MIDSFEMVCPMTQAAGEAARLRIEPGRYMVATLHRPSNVDTLEALTRLVAALEETQKTLPIIFPVHPRTAARLNVLGMRRKLEAAEIRLVEPLPYIRFMSLVVDVAATITDSCGLQEETTYLGIPCLTLQSNTERPITVSEGTNRLVAPDDLAAELRAALVKVHTPARPEYWDSTTAGRCVADLRQCSAPALGLR